jgi:hypothetical protein
LERSPQAALSTLPGASPGSVLILHQLHHSSIPPSYIQTIHLIENCTYLHNFLIEPINYNNNGTATATETPADGQQQQRHQRPTARTYTYFSLSTLLKPMFHAIHPNPSMLKYVILKLEIHRPYGRVESSNGIAAAARPRRPAPTYPARWRAAR